MVSAADVSSTGTGRLLSGIPTAKDSAGRVTDSYGTADAEIGKIMDIKLPTVKTHVSHILDKLGVSRRSEAKTAAKKRWLIPDHL